MLHFGICVMQWVVKKIPSPHKWLFLFVSVLWNLCSNMCAFTLWFVALNFEQWANLNLKFPWFSKRLPRFLLLRIGKNQKSYDHLTLVVNKPPWKNINHLIKLHFPLNCSQKITLKNNLVACWTPTHSK